MAGVSHIGSVSRLGYFDGLASTHFRTLEDGTRVFYPSGVYGRCGVVVPSWAVEHALRRRLKARFGWTGALAVAVVSAAGRYVAQMNLLLFATVLVAGWACERLLSWLFFRSLIRRMERADTPNSLVACWDSMGKTMHPALLAFLSIFTAGMASGGFLMYALKREPKGILVGLMFTIVFVQYAAAMWSGWRR